MTTQHEIPEGQAVMTSAHAEFVKSLAQEIRRVDGRHDLGADALAEALTPWIESYSDTIEVEVIPKEIIEWMEARDLLPDSEENGSIDIDDMIQALDTHESECLRVAIRPWTLTRLSKARIWMRQIIKARVPRGKLNPFSSGVRK